MRVTVCLTTLLLACGLATAQQPLKGVRLAPQAAPAPQSPQGVTVDGQAVNNELPVSPAEMQELVCVNEYQFKADPITATKVLLHLVVTSNACKTKGRKVDWLVSADDGASFVPVRQSAQIRKYSESAQGIEVELIPDATYFFHPSVTLFKDVRTEGPVLIYPPADMQRAMTVAGASAAPAKKP